MEGRGESLSEDCSLGQPWRLEEERGERGKVAERKRETKEAVPCESASVTQLCTVAWNNAGTKTSWL